MTSLTFFQQLQKIINATPKLCSDVSFSDNCEYCHQVIYCKNLYYGFYNASCSDSIYMFDGYMAVNCVDGDYLVECENCYECVDVFQSFSCDYSFNCDHCRDISWSWYCSNSHDIFGCVHADNRSFCIFNRQLSESDYRQKIKIYQNWPQEKIIKQLKLIYEQLPVAQLFTSNNQNSPYGNNSYFNKNVYLSFDIAHNEDCGYLYDCHYNKYCYDMTYASRYSEYSYQVVESDNIHECCFILGSSTCQSSYYLIDCKNCRYCFGCAGLRNRQYCILNRQLTKEQYEALLPKLKDELSKTGWGWDNINF